ncbi:MAG: universal stress protein [Bacteroidia bacterium]|nr:universal stress protein [Bacteroidia bacterium]
MQTLIVGTDFSKPANNAVDYAALLSRYLSARLILVNAFHMPLQGYNSLSPVSVASELQRHSESQLDIIKSTLLANSYDFGIEIYSSLGSATTVLKEAVNKYLGDLVVMGMTGEGIALKEIFIGSSAVSALKELKVPVLIVPQQVTYQPIKRITLACDLEHVEESTLMYSARYFAKLFNAELEIVTVQNREKETHADNKHTQTFIEKTLDGVKHKQVFIEEDNILKGLEYYLKFHETDLVIVNPKKHKFFEKLLNASVSKHIAYHSTKPVLFIQ